MGRRAIHPEHLVAKAKALCGIHIPRKVVAQLMGVPPGTVGSWVAGRKHVKPDATLVPRILKLLSEG